MDKIKDQANKVSGLVFSADTGATYTKALTRTWEILRETGILLWLAVCLIFVGIEWFWKTSISLGRRGRDWYEGLRSPSTEAPKSAGEMGQSALTALSFGADNLFYQAKKQLGMSAEPPTPKPVVTKTHAASDTAGEASVQEADNSDAVSPTEYGKPVPPTVVAKHNSPETPESPGTKTGLASAATQSKKIEAQDDAETAEAGDGEDE